MLTADLDLISKVPSKFVSHYKFVPISIKDDVMTIALSDPFDMHTVDALKLLLKKDIRVVAASETDIKAATKKYYGIGAETFNKIAPESPALKSLSVSHGANVIENSAEDASVIKFVNELLLEAYRERATDIHMEPYEDVFDIRYRIDGILYDANVPPDIKRIQAAITSRIKIMAQLDIAEKRLPQDGRIKVKVGKDEVDMRVSILPTPFGEAVVIRLLSQNVFFGMENLGLLKKDLELLEKLIRAPHGIIFVTGPTGSGKTTTLYASLNKINSRELKIVTIEDPIEYQMKGMVQMQVHPKIKLTFSQGLRSMLRHDPDIMMVGEVRDYETAEITIRVALTGHLVFSTIHTNDAPGGITRLIDMGVEPFLVASSVNAFIAQRLVRLICPECKRQITAKEEVLRELGVYDKAAGPVTIYEGKGCEACKFTGYKGRTAIYEILAVNNEIRDLVLKRSSSEQIKKKAIALGMRTLRQDGWEKILMGLTSPEEVIRVTQGEEIWE